MRLIHTLLLGLGLATAPISFGSSGFDIAWPVALAQDCASPQSSPELCGPIAPEGHVFHGNLQQNLTQQVTLCHPNWDNLAVQWYSYAIFVEGQLSRVVDSLRRHGEWNQEVELPVGQECHTRFFDTNWRFAVFDPCVVEGYNVLRVATPFNGARLDAPEEWPIVTGSDGRYLLFGA